MRPVACGTTPMPSPQPGGLRQAFRETVSGARKCGRNRNSTTSRMASHGMNAAIIAGMLRRSSSPASTANPNADRM